MSRRLEGYLVMTLDCPITVCFNKQDATIAMHNLRQETRTPNMIHAFHSWITLDDNNNLVEYEEYGDEDAPSDT
jgi:hypothetical protein